MPTTKTKRRRTRNKYRLLPPLPPDDYEALKANIALNGIVVPVVTDEHGNILDGFARRLPPRNEDLAGHGQWAAIPARDLGATRACRAGPAPGQVPQFAGPDLLDALGVPDQLQASVRGDAVT